MGFKEKIDQLGQKVGGAVAKAQDSTKTFTEKTKLKSKINAENDKINKLYTSIGKKYVEMFGANPSEEFIGFISEINASNELIKSYNLQLASLDDVLYCTSCGAQIAKDSDFCSKCGAKQEIPVVQNVEVVEDTQNDTTISLEK